MNGRVTIADVANHLGVSKSTVSHALSGKRRISAEVRSQVMQAVKELGYRPNFAARVMNTRRTGLVGVLVDSLNNPHNTALQEEFGRAFSSYSIQMVLGTADRLEDGRSLLAKFCSGMVDGILNTLPELDADEAQELAGSIPVVTYRRHRQSPLVIDFAAGTRTALAYLLKLGHRHIAMIPSGNRMQNNLPDPCCTAYCEQMALIGVPPQIIPVREDTLQAGYEVADRLFDGNATAVLAGNDAVAAGLIRRAIERGIRLPEHMSIIGHDDSPIAVVTSPPLTTLRLPIGPIAAHTVQILMHAVDPAVPVPEPLTIVPELIVRKSSVNFDNQKQEVPYGEKKFYTH